MKEKLESRVQSKTESEIRLGRLGDALKVIKARLSSEEMGKVRAIVLYGSTARGEAKKTSDIDLHIDLDPYDDEAFKKIMRILQAQFAGLDVGFSANKIIEGGRMAKLITAQRNPDKSAAWEFIYCRSKEEEMELNRILLEKQKQRQAGRSEGVLS